MAYRNVGERLGDVMQNVGAAYPQYAMQQQQMKRLGENDAFNQDIATQRLGLAQNADARAQDQFGINMLKQQEPEPGYKPRNIEEYYALTGDWEGLTKYKGASGGSEKPPFTPKQWYDGVQKTYDGAVQGGQRGVLNNADEQAARLGVTNTDDTPLSIGSRQDLVTGKQTYGERLRLGGGEGLAPMREGVEWTNDFSHANPMASALGQFDRIGSPEHEAAFMSSPDSLWQHNPAMAAMGGLEQPQQPQEYRTQPDVSGLTGFSTMEGDAEKWARGEIIGYDNLPAEVKQQILQKRMSEMGTR